VVPSSTRHEKLKRLSAFERLCHVMLCDALASAAVSAYARDIREFVQASSDTAVNAQNDDSASGLQPLVEAKGSRRAPLAVSVVFETDGARHDTPATRAVGVFDDGAGAFVALLDDLALRYLALRSGEAKAHTDQVPLGTTTAIAATTLTATTAGALSAASAMATHVSVATSGDGGGGGGGFVSSNPAVVVERDACLRDLESRMEASATECDAVCAWVCAWAHEVHASMQGWDEVALRDVAAGPLDATVQLMDRLGGWWVRLGRVALWTATDAGLFDVDATVIHASLRPRVLAVMRDVLNATLRRVQASSDEVCQGAATLRDDLVGILALDVNDPVQLAMLVTRPHECRVRADTIATELANCRSACRVYRELISQHPAQLAPRADKRAAGESNHAHTRTRSPTCVLTNSTTGASGNPPPPPHSHTPLRPPLLPPHPMTNVNYLLMYVDCSFTHALRQPRCPPLQPHAASALAAAEAAHNEVTALLFSVDVTSRQQHAPGVVRVAARLQELEGQMIPIVRDVCGAGPHNASDYRNSADLDADVMATLARVRDQERSYSSLLLDAQTVAAAARLMNDEKESGVDLDLQWCETGQRAISCRRHLWELLCEVQVGAHLHIAPTPRKLNCTLHQHRVS
jgi:hypothetical protein